MKREKISPEVSQKQHISSSTQKLSEDLSRQAIFPKRKAITLNSMFTTFCSCFVDSRSSDVLLVLHFSQLFPHYISCFNLLGSSRKALCLRQIFASSLWRQNAHTQSRTNVHEWQKVAPNLQTSLLFQLFCFDWNSSIFFWKKKSSFKCLAESKAGMTLKLSTELQSHFAGEGNVAPHRPDTFYTNNTAGNFSQQDKKLSVNTLDISCFKHQKFCVCNFAIYSSSAIHTYFNFFLQHEIQDQIGTPVFCCEVHVQNWWYNKRCQVCSNLHFFLFRCAVRKIPRSVNRA